MSLSVGVFSCAPPEILYIHAGDLCPEQPCSLAAPGATLVEINAPFSEAGFRIWTERIYGTAHLDGVPALTVHLRASLVVIVALG